MAETKRKGRIAELAVVAEAIARGYRVSIPFGEDSPYDLVVERNGRLERVQCKYGVSDGRVLVVKCECTNNWSRTRYTNHDVEWLVAYDHASRRCFYIPSAVLGENGRSSVHLRLAPTANKQRIGIWWAEDFTTW